MRTHYTNGDEVTLQHNGCDGCSPCTINGVLCHEHGCPDAWRDKATVDTSWDADDGGPGQDYNSAIQDLMDPW